jgi:hypothetical protein
MLTQEFLKAIRDDALHVAGMILAYCRETKDYDTFTTEMILALQSIEKAADKKSQSEVREGQVQS